MDIIRKIYSVGFKDFLYKGENNPKSNFFIYYGCILDRSLMILIEHKVGESIFGIKSISIDHDNENELINQYFGNNPSIDTVIKVLSSNVLN